MAAGLALVVFATVLVVVRGGGEPQAHLAVLERNVELQRGGEGEFAEPSQRVAAGDVLRTDETGLAQIDYDDGSLTRVGPQSTFRVEQLSEGRAPERLLHLERGRTWHRVVRLTGTQGRYEVGTPNATAAVRGTAFSVVCMGGGICTYKVAEGRVEVTTISGDKLLLEAGQSVTVDASGRMSPLRKLSAAQLRSDAWIRENIRRDTGLGHPDPLLTLSETRATPAPQVLGGTSEAAEDDDETEEAEEAEETDEEAAPDEEADDASRGEGVGSVSLRPRSGGGTPLGSPRFNPTPSPKPTPTPAPTPTPGGPTPTPSPSPTPSPTPTPTPTGDPGEVRGTVTNASDGEPLSDATVRVHDADTVLHETSTGADGSYSFASVAPGTYSVQATAAGFIPARRDGVEVRSSEATVVNLTMSTTLDEGELRVVLTWGETPNDLDSHLWLPPEQPYHVYYADRGELEEFPYAQLDVDDTSGHGPETITIGRLLEGTYTYAVHNFSGSPDITTSGARVEVFSSSGLVASYPVPTSGSGTWWKVFELDGVTGEITPVNTIEGGDPGPY